MSATSASESAERGVEQPLVLLVEDDVDVRESMAEALEDAHYSVLQATNGRAALDDLRVLSRLPSLIVLDLMMPVMDGWQFRAEQIQDPRLAGIPVIVVSATTRVDRPLVGVSEILKKPISLDQLLQAVARYTRVAA